MTAVNLNCPLCTGLFQTDSSLAGAEVMCPQCGGVVVVPQVGTSSQASSGKVAAAAGDTKRSAAEGKQAAGAGRQAAGKERPPDGATRQLGCPDCYRTFPVPIDRAGSQASCPHCGRRVNVPLSWKTALRPAETPRPTPTAADTARLDATVRERETASEVAAADDMLPPSAAPDSPPAAAETPDDMLPPAAVDTVPATGTSAASGHRFAAQPDSVDSQLPPSAATDADSLLPPSSPGAEPPMAPPETAAVGGGTASATSPGAAALSGRGVEIGVSAAHGGASGDARGDVVLIPTEDGTNVALREPVRTVGHGEHERELHSLTREEKERYRSLKSAITWALCTLVLVTALLVLISVSK